MDRPEPGKQYRLIGKKNEPSIARGNSWKQSQIVYNNKPDPIVSIKVYEIDENGKRILKEVRK